MSEFTHLDDNQQPGMVDVGNKEVTRRTAQAQSIVVLGQKIMSLLQGDDIVMPKGPVFQTAIIAGIMAAKKTHDLIPMCHPLALDSCKVEITPVDEMSVRITSYVRISDRTGVEMEALTAASIAALTVYDMCKALSKGIVIAETKLISKTGGKSDYASSDSQ